MVKKVSEKSDEMRRKEEEYGVEFGENHKEDGLCRCEACNTIMWLEIGGLEYE